MKQKWDKKAWPKANPRICYKDLKKPIQEILKWMQYIYFQFRKIIFNYSVNIKKNMAWIITHIIKLLVIWQFKIFRKKQIVVRSYKLVYSGSPKLNICANLKTAPFWHFICFGPENFCYLGHLSLSLFFSPSEKKRHRKNARSSFSSF